MVDYLGDYSWMLAGGHRRFDEAAVRDLVRRDVERAHDFAAVQNHDSIPDGERPHGSLSSIAVPVLVIHGTADPMFPIAHGEALAEQVPSAKQLPLGGVGHGVGRADWETVVRAILVHTGSADPDRGR